MQGGRNEFLEGIRSGAQCGDAGNREAVERYVREAFASAVREYAEAAVHTWAVANELLGEFGSARYRAAEAEARAQCDRCSEELAEVVEAAQVLGIELPEEVEV